MLTDLPRLHAGAHLNDGTDGLVPENASRRRLGNVALQDVQIGSADRGRIHSRDDVAIVFDLRVRDFAPALAARSLVHECVHRPTSASNPRLLSTVISIPTMDKVPTW